MGKPTKHSSAKKFDAFLKHHKKSAPEHENAEITGQTKIHLVMAGSSRDKFIEVLQYLINREYQKVDRDENHAFLQKLHNMIVATPIRGFNKNKEEQRLSRYQRKIWELYSKSQTGDIEGQEDCVLSDKTRITALHLGQHLYRHYPKFSIPFMWGIKDDGYKFEWLEGHKRLLICILEDEISYTKFLAGEFEEGKTTVQDCLSLFKWFEEEKESEINRGLK